MVNGLSSFLRRVESQEEIGLDTNEQIWNDGAEARENSSSQRVPGHTWFRLVASD